MSEVLHGNASGDQINASADKTQVYGLSGNDTLISNKKSDALLIGGSGDDSLIMLGGKGTLSGGKGADTFELNYSATNPISAVIEDLDPAEDKIVVNFDGKFTFPPLSTVNGDDVVWSNGGNFNLTVKSVRENDYFDGDASDEAWKVLELTNDEREKENLSWLTMSDGLTEGAQIRAGEITGLADRGALSSHDRPDNKGGYSTIFDDVDKHYFHFGENLQAGAESAAEVMQDWIGSPSHYANIMNPDFLKLGVGYNYKDLSKNEYYWTQLFADSLNNPETISAENLSTVIPEMHTTRKFISLTRYDDIRNNDEYGATIDAKSGDDFITNSGLVASISGGKGKDTIDNSSAFVTINAGAGNDLIQLGIRNEELVIEYALGDGSDTVSGLNSTDTLKISGGEYTPVTVGNDVIVSIGADSIKLVDAPETFTIEGVRSKLFLGTEGDDKLNNTVDGATIQALGGNDKITISGENVLLVHESGSDTVSGFNDTSTLKILGKNYSSVTSGKNLILTDAGANNSITILDGSKLNVINIVDAKGKPLEIERTKNIVGTDNPDNLKNGSDDVTIQALGGDDTITNRGDGVSIDGGADNDSINNTGSDATITGGAGSDTIKNTGDNNSISGGADADTIEISGDENTINADSGDDFISIKGARNVIEYVAGGGSDVIEGFNQTSTLRISGDVYTSATSDKDVVVTVGDAEISLVGAAKFDKINIVGTAQTETTSSDYVDYNGHRYQLFDDGMTWEEAKAYCETLGGHLVVITSADEQAAVQSLLESKGTKNSYWMGGFKGNNEKLITLTENDDTYNNISVEGVTIQALGGNDSISNGGNGAIITGGTGNDSIRNAGDKVLIDAGDGNDSIDNHASNVTISGGTGDDSVYNDSYASLTSIDLGAGDDTIQNFGGSSTIDGGAGDDSIQNYGSSSIIDAGAGNDEIDNWGSDSLTIDGGEGDDWIRNYDSVSSIFGGDGADTIDNSGNSSTVLGDAGNDYISNGGDSVTMDGGAGDDSIQNSGDNVTIIGDTGNDYVSNGDGQNMEPGVNILVDLGAGDDSIWNHKGGSSASIYGYSGNDSIHNYSDSVLIDAGADDDSIYSQASNVTIKGGDGVDSIRNWGASSIIDGGVGDDSIENLGESSTIDGGVGDDSISISANNNVIQYTAGDGNDTIYGFDDYDTLSIVGATYSTTTSGDDVIVSVGDGSISLVGAASLAAINILNDTTPANVADDTTTALEPLDPTEVIVLSENDDSLYNTVEGAEIRALGGNDTVDNNEANVIIYGGDDDDSLSNYSEGFYTTINGDAGADRIINWGASVSIAAGEGNDYILNESLGAMVTIDAGAGDDSIHNEGYNATHSTIDGGAGSDSISGYFWASSILGGADSDLISISNNENTISGGTGDDSISLSSSSANNFISYASGEGDDTITGFNDTSTLSISDAEYSTTTSGNDVIVTVGEGSIRLIDAANLDAINIEGTLNSSSENGDSWQWVTGETWDYTNWNDNEPDGSGNYLQMYAVDVDDSEYGIEKGKWDDTTNDLSTAGYSTTKQGLICEWETIPNSKLIVLTENADDYGESMESGTTLKALGGNDNINNWSGDSVTIDLGADDDYILNHSSYVLIEGADGSDTVASWIDDDYSAYNTIRGGAGDDSIDNHGHHTLIEGNDGNDTLYNYVGDDGGIHQGYEANYSTVRGGRGNDQIDNQGNHVLIEGGTGNDTIANRNGAWFDDEAEYSTIYGGAGKDSIFNQGDFVSIDGGAGDDTINNEGSQVSINGNAGDDSIDNHGKNDTILGGTGNDEISLSTASKNNFIRYADGDGNDTVWGATPDDTINILGVESYSSVKSGKNDLLIKVGNGSILLKDARNRPPKITLGESGSSGGTGGGGSGSSGGNSGGGSGGSNSSGGTSSSSNSNSAASGGNSASGSSGISSATSSGGSGRGSRTIARQTSATVNQPVQTIRNQIISNYQSGSKINSNEGHTGAFFDSTGNFYSGSTAGAIVIPDAMNKLIDLRDAAGNPFIKAYAASNAGVIDGRKLAGFEIIDGSAGADEIYAGRNGAQMSGGYGNDTMTGGRGVDIFVSGKAQGNDLIRNASLLDKVKLTDVTLNDISTTRENGKTISLTFRTGNVINVEYEDILSPKFIFADGSSYLYNRASQSWRVMSQASTAQNVYAGGEQTISSYQSGDKILFNVEYRGGGYDGEGNFSVNSSAGTLVVKNAADKVIDLTNNAGNSFVKAYAASKSGVIDGRELTGYQIINGSAGADVICAGNGGSQLWGGAEADVLVGGAGVDTFITGKMQGADLIRNAATADNVNLNDSTLSDIVATSESNGMISLSFNTGNVVNVQSSEALSARFILADGSSYRYNHARHSWQSA